MVRMNHPSPFQVGREFVRQYYSLLNKAPEILHRFYGINSSYVHGSGYHSEPDEEVTGQNAIHKKILSLNFKECHTKVYQVDAHSTLGNGVVVQVIGELSNNRKPLRRFMQTFVLAPQGDNPYKFYVHNDIFRYEDEVYRDDISHERQDEEHVSDPDGDDDSEPAQMPPAHCENHVNAPTQLPQIGSKIEQQLDSQANSDSQPSPTPPSPPTVTSDPHFEPIQDPPMDMEPQADSPAFPIANDMQDPQVDAVTKDKDVPDLLGKDTESAQVTSWAALASKNTPAQHNFQQGTVVKMNQAHEGGNVDPSQKPAQRPQARSQPPQQRDDSGDVAGDIGGRRGTRYPDNQQIFVGNLPFDITEADLREHFSEFGEIIDVRINHSNTSNPSFGFIIFEDPKSVEEVLRQMPTTFKNNKRINIEEKKQRGLPRDGRRGPGSWEMRRDNNRGGRMHTRGPPRKEWGGSKEGPRAANNYGPRR